MTKRIRNILGSVALALVVLGILPLVLGVVQLVLAVRVATLRATLILIATGVAAITAGIVLDRWLRKRTAEAPRGFDVVVREDGGSGQ